MNETTTQVVIDKAAMFHITDIAINLLKYSTGPVNDRALLFQALSEYVASKGVTPGFEVKFK